MRTIISIDWDFFVPEDVRWDFGHAENLLFLNMVWMTRSQLMDEMTTDGEEQGFWDKLTNHADIEGASFNVSDSHSYGYQMARGADHLVLFDTHHDVWPWNRKSDHVNCDNWARFWLMSNPHAKMTWVRSAHSDYTLEGFDDFHGAERIEVLTWGKDVIPDFGRVNRVHVCRSGCWTPPWLDQSFIDFVSAGAKAIGTPVECLPEDDGWNPLARRWSDEEFKQARHLGEQMKELTNRVGE